MGRVRNETRRSGWIERRFGVSLRQWLVWRLMDGDYVLVKRSAYDDYTRVWARHLATD